MMKYKFLTSKEIINTRNNLRNKYPDNYTKKIKDELGLNDVQIKYLLNTNDKNVKKKLYELANENEKFALVKILESKYYMYNFYTPYKKIGGSIFFVCTLIVTILSLIFAKEYPEILIIFGVMVLISLFLVVYYYLTYKNINGLEEKIIDDNIIDYEATIKSIVVINPYETVFFRAGKIAFLRVNLVSDEQNYILIPVNQIEMRDSKYNIDKKLTNIYKNKNIKIKSYKKSKFLISSSINWEGISKEIINNF